jgi:hypothetical protein
MSTLRINANSLKTSRKQIDQINRTIIDILSDIDQKILEYHAACKYKLMINLPIMFTIDDVPNNILQRKIYYGILKDLKNRNFEVSIDLGSDYCRLYIQWVSSEEVNNIAAENELIAQCTKKISP